MKTTTAAAADPARAGLLPEVPPTKRPINSSHPVYWLMVLIWCFVWAAGYPAAKVAYTVAPPLLFSGIRFCIAGFLFLGLAGLRGEWAVLPNVRWRWLALLGLLNIGLPTAAVWVAVGQVSSGLAAVITSSVPVFTALLAVLFLSERLTAAKLIGLVLGVGGVALLVRDRLAGGGEGWFGVALLFAGMVTQVIGVLAYKRSPPRLPPNILMFGLQVSGGLTLVAGGVLTREHVADIQFTGKMWMVFLWTLLVNSLAGQPLWYFLLKRGSATTATSLQFLVPPMGMFLGWIGLGETVGLVDIASLIPIALGIRLVTRERAAPS